MLVRESSEYKPEARMTRYETSPKAQNSFESRSSSRSRDRRPPTSSTANQDFESEIFPKAQNGFDSRSSSRSREGSSSTANEDSEWEIIPKAQNGFESRSSARSRNRRPLTSSMANQDSESEIMPKAQNGFDSRSSSRSCKGSSSTANEDSEWEIMPKAQNGFESRSSARSHDRRPPTSLIANQDSEWEIRLYVPDKKRSMNAIVLLDTGCDVGNWVSWNYLTDNCIEGEMRGLDRPIIADDINGNPVHAIGLISFLWKVSPEGQKMHGPVAFNVANSWSLGVDMIFGRSYLLRQKLVTTNRDRMLPLVPHKTAKPAEKLQISESKEKQRQEKASLDARRQVSQPEGQYYVTQPVEYPASDQGSCSYQPNTQTDIHQLRRDHTNQHRSQETRQTSR